MRKKGFLHFFSYSNKIFEDKSKNQMERTATYCTDLGKFADHVCQKRGHSMEDVDVIIGADDGKEVNKITMTILPKIKANSSVDQNNTSESAN